MKLSHKLMIFVAAIVCSLSMLTQAQSRHDYKADKPLTSKKLFPIKIGQHWRMVNKFGDVTTWSVKRIPRNSSCERDGRREVILKIEKTASRTYWALGVPEATDEWVLHQDADGSWRSVDDTNSMPQGCAWCGNVKGYSTLQWRPVEGMPMVNVIVPGRIRIGETLGEDTEYHLYNTQGHTFRCIVSVRGADRGIVRGNWFRNTLAYVDTPVYRGMALRDDQVEGSWNHEVWWFAPGVGLVEIDAQLKTPNGHWASAYAEKLAQEYGSEVVTIKRID